MITYPYLNNFAKLSLMFSKLRDSNVPTKFTFRYWALLGFTSSQDRAFIDLLKFLGYLDANGYPTNYYAALRNQAEFSSVLAERLKESYKDLFALDKNANLLTLNVLTDYFIRLTASDVSLAQKQALTFKELCDKAHFNFEKSLEVPAVSTNKPSSSKIVFNINLPETTDPEVYKAIFDHLKTLLE